MKKNFILLGILALLIGGVIWVRSKSHTSTLADEALTNFAIEDTASVTKMFIADHLGNTIQLERQADSKLWKLNGKYEARKDVVDLLLDLIKRVSVRGNVPEKARDNMMKMIASTGKKFEIYTSNPSKPDKIYYVGPNTPDHMGTIMLLEIPGKGRSQDPYITHIEGFTGFLNPRFFTNELDWRYTGIFEFSNLDFQSVKVELPATPQESFEIKYNGGNDIRLLACVPQTGECTIPVSTFDTLAVKDYLLLFKKLHIESYNTYLKPAAEDSIKRTIPECRVSVKDNKGKMHSVSIYKKKTNTEKLDGNGNLTNWDPEYYWAMNSKNELAMAQKHLFMPLLTPISTFAPKK
jgi:hypothetical protein